MLQASLDALVLTSPVNIRYFTDYWLWSDELFREYMLSPGAPSSRLQIYAIYPFEGAPALVVLPLSAANASDSWVKDLYVYGSGPIDRSRKPIVSDPQHILNLLSEPQLALTPIDAVLSALQDRGLADARLGVELEGVLPAVAAGLRQKLPRAAIADCTNLVRLIRTVKSPTEIELLKRSAEITELAAREALQLACPGVSIRAIIERFRVVVAQAAGNFDHAAFGLHGLGIATEPDWLLSSEVMFADFGCTYRGYFSDTGFTVAIDTAEFRPEYEGLEAGIRAGSDAMRPGVASSQVQIEMQNALAARGIQASFPHGHGLGLEIRDYPILVPRNGLRIRDGCVDVSSDLSLEAGMVINLEAAVWHPGLASLQIEQSFEITAEGSRPLTSQDRSQPILVGTSGTVRAN